jgi:hypothetical protein
MRTELPGGWVDLADLKSLTPENQDDYLDRLSEARERKEQAALAAVAAANPAVMPDPDADPPAVRLSRRDVKPVHDLVCAWVVQDISWPGVLPWDAGSRDRLAAAAGLGTWNALLAALGPYFSVLNGEVPKENVPSTATSAIISAESATAPPAVSPQEQSAMPAG